QLSGVNRFVRLTGGFVVHRRNLIPLVFRNPVDQTEGLFLIFPAARDVTGIVERDAKEVVSHREIRIDSGGALKQRSSGYKIAMVHLRNARRVVLKGLERRSGGFFQRTIQLLD